MRSIAELRGLRFPDDYVVKMFFKEGLHRRVGQVLELGCGSGNNLMLFGAFGWGVTGVDNDAVSLADAAHNLEGAGTLIECDLSARTPDFGAQSFDVILLPSVNYYVPRTAFARLLDICLTVLRPGGLFYIRSRLPEDWRYGRGSEEGPGAFRLECRETGEYGLLNVFYTAEELSNLMGRHLGELLQPQRLRVIYDNPQGGIVIRNADIVIWGKKAGE